MNNKSVSVIIPAYNAEDSLGRCIESAFSQELQPAEVIVINDEGEPLPKEMGAALASGRSCIS